MMKGLARLRKIASPRDLRYLGMLAKETFRNIPPAPHRPDPASWRNDEITVAWLGHATVLLNFFGVTVLVDPVLASRVGIQVGPLILGPKRFVRPALTVDELPPIDLVLLTHAHMDHLDTWTLSRLPGKPRVLTPRGVSDLLDPTRFCSIDELAVGASIEAAMPGGTLRVEAVPVAHWGARMHHDTHRGYCGFLLERNGRRVCFAGDTARTSFENIGARGGVDLIVMPIGAYNPWIGSHCNPEQAVAMANEARAHFIVPVHHQTFRFSAEPLSEPIARFRAALAHEPGRLALSEIGETFVLPTRAEESL